MTCRSVLLPLFVLASSVACPAQVWIRLQPAQEPDREVGTSLVLHEGTQTVFGFAPGQTFTLDTVWSWSGSSWSSTQVGTAPFVRPMAEYVYDPRAGAILVLCGLAGDAINSHWSFDGSSWTQVNTGIDLRSNPAAAYHAVQDKVVLFGGSGIMGAMNDTWVLDGTFQQLMPATVPPPRFLHKMVYDVKRQKIVMLGGSGDGIVDMGDTWEWDGTDWSVVMTTHSPGPRRAYSMAYDSDREVTVLHGGLNGLTTQLSDTWEYDGTDWTKTSDSGPDSFSPHRMVYEATAKRMLLVNESRDTWVYTGEQAASYEPFGQGCPGSLGPVSLDSAGGDLPVIGDGFDVLATNVSTNSLRVDLVVGFDDQKFGNLDLPLDLGLFGLFGCTAYIDVFVAVQMNRSGTMASFTLDIPNDPSLLGQDFFNQALVNDPGAPNPAGFVVTNAAKGIIGT